MLGALCGRGLNLVRMKDNANEDKCKLQIQTKQQSFTHPIALTLGEKNHSLRSGHPSKPVQV